MSESSSFGGAAPVPPMTFRVEDLLDGDRMQNGPLVVFWGQEHEEFCRRGDLPWPELERLPLRARLRRWRWFRIALRVQPADGTDLKTFGQDIARILGVPYGGDPEEGDRAIWLPAHVPAKDAGNALASAGLVLKRLGGLKASAVQVRVEAAGEREGSPSQKEEGKTGPSGSPGGVND